MILLDLYKKYGLYSAARALPGIDGLMLVERRVLLTGYEVCRNRFVKSSNVIGNCMATYHPHSDMSIYGTIVKLVNWNFFKGQGNFGAEGIVPIPPAASRYTEVKLNDEILFAFEYLKYTNKMEIEATDEPVNLPTPFPLLLGNDDKIGLSFFNVRVPQFNSVKCLKKLQLKFLGQNIELNECLPHHKNTKVIEIPDNWYKLTSFQVIRVIDHMYDKKNNTVEMYAINQPKKLLKSQENYKIIIEDNSTSEINIKVFLNKQYDYNKLFEQILKYSTTYRIMYFDYLEWQPYEITIEQLFLKCWEQYLQILSKYIQDMIRVYNDKIIETQILKVTKEILRKQNITNIDTLVNLVSQILKQIDVSIIRNTLSNKTIKSLIESEYDEEKYRNELKNWQNTKPEKYALEKLKTL